MRKSTLNLGALALSTLLLAGCPTPIQMYYDAEVDKLCKIDGGMVVHETIELDPANFDEHGGLRSFSPILQENALGELFRYEHHVTYIKGQSGQLDTLTLTRRHIRIVRRDDEKLLGELVRYGRHGGDIPLGVHPSGYGCPTDGADLRDLLRAVFKPAEAPK